MTETTLLKQLVNELNMRQSWPKEEVVDRVKGKLDIAREENEKKMVKEIKLYDFFSFKLLEISHPCVIFRIDTDCVWGIITSSNSDGAHHNVAPIEGSRLLSGGWWTTTIVSQTHEDVLSHWLGIFDNPADVKKAVKLLKERYSKILK